MNKKTLKTRKNSHLVRRKWSKINQNVQHLINYYKKLKTFYEFFGIYNFEVF